MQRYRPFGNDECVDAALFWDAETINWTKGNELAGLFMLLMAPPPLNRFACGK